MSELVVESLSFSYGARTVLRDISFTVRPGDFVALLGPNGAGKSTLFRSILRFSGHYGGVVRVDGVDTRSMARRALAQKVAYIPQSSQQAFDYTIMELVLMGAAMRLPLFKTPDAKEEARALGILGELGIAHLAERSCDEVSGGEYQLALLARTLMQEASILIMDEPTANLDYGNQFRVMERVSKLVSSGFAVIMSAHDPNQVLQHASRVLVIDEGTLCADGAPAEVMTEGLLSKIYGVGVQRLSVSDRGRTFELCSPVSSDGRYGGVFGSSDRSERW